MGQLRPILLVEDDPRDVELTVEAMRECRLLNSIDVAWDGAEALDYLYRRGVHAARRGGDPVVVLLDLKLPKLSGIEVLRAIKTDPALRSIPVVILTSSRELSDREACYAIGANAYVVKPVQFPEFVQAVQTIGLFWAVLNETPVCDPEG